MGPTGPGGSGDPDAGWQSTGQYEAQALFPQWWSSTGQGLVDSEINNWWSQTSPSLVTIGQVDSEINNWWTSTGRPYVDNAVSTSSGGGGGGGGSGITLEQVDSEILSYISPTGASFMNWMNGQGFGGFLNAQYDNYLTSDLQNVNSSLNKQLNQIVSNQIGNINTNGMPGPQGEQGPTGPQGPTGSTGAIGSQGPTGPQGLQGEIGFTGPQGPMGPQGSAGQAGQDGAGLSDANITLLQNLANVPVILGGSIANQLRGGQGLDSILFGSGGIISTLCNQDSSSGLWDCSNLAPLKTNMAALVSGRTSLLYSAVPEYNSPYDWYFHN
jgi:hypothetical protein